MSFVCAPSRDRKLALAAPPTCVSWLSSLRKVGSAIVDVEFGSHMRNVG